MNIVLGQAQVASLSRRLGYKLEFIHLLGPEVLGNQGWAHLLDMLRAKLTCRGYLGTAGVTLMVRGEKTGKCENALFGLAK
jgi:hypothetical protein